jgi:hypothetical protein
VRPLGVVSLEPGLGRLTHLVEGVEEIRVEDLFTERAIEPLDEGILVGLPRLNVSRWQLRCAVHHSTKACEFGPIVDAHPTAAAVQPNAIVEDADHTGTGN